jgi:hypothetical protein
MRLIDADQMLVDESEAYLCVQTREDISPITQGINSVVHRKIQQLIADTPTVDAVEVVRCQDCVHAVPLDRNCELSTSLYMHCCLWRGDETKNVWHKYKKYYKDYSLVERDDFCSMGERLDRKDGADNE